MNSKIVTKQYEKEANIILPYTQLPVVSIIIPIYNQVDFTYNCIRSIHEYCGDTNYEIIIADDNSPEDTSVLQKYFDNLIFIKNSVNLGFLKNCNNAAHHARGKYILFLNNDTQVQENWLSELLFVFDKFPKVGLVGSMLIYPNGLLQEAGGIIWQDGSASNFGCRDNPNRPEYNYIKESDYISGASIMIAASLWNDIGGFDEQFTPAYNEDSDLCFEIRRRGYKVYFQPFSRVIHFEGVSHGTDVKEGIKQYQVINKEKFTEKWSSELACKAKRNTNVFYERDRSAGKKHILIIDHNVPTIDKDAGSRTISNFIDAFLELDCEVKFMVPNMHPLYNYVKLLQEKGVEVLHGGKFIYFKHEWEAYFAANMEKFDAILLSRSSVCAPYLKYLRQHKYAGKIIYYGHDLGYLRTEQEMQMTGNMGLKKVIKKTKTDEDYMYQNADTALVISNEELDYLKKYIKAPLHYIPPYFFDVKQSNVSYKERQGILFVGGFHHPPNQDAMKWFLGEIYAQLHNKGIALTIAGSEMPDFIFQYKQQFKLLEVLPDVSTATLESLYARTRIAIVPLKVGAGVKGKVIEAMAKGVPVAGTDRAFEGLKKDDEFIYRGFNTTNELIENILEIYQDEQKWKLFSDFGQRYVENYFNKQKMVEVFKKIIA
ncbi:MAG: glycosyltransferase [Taibaiella sp.]|nr:glycosyltransferase [Taibaiella sp.]